MAGETLSDKYELGALLGEGGFGKTYAARELASGAAVVVKQLTLRELPEWKPVEQFEREARVLASLSHRGVPRFIDAIQEQGSDGDVRLFLVSERIEGETLGAKIADGKRWSTTEAIALTRGLLEILRYLHELLPPVIHRDIKPDNIILRPDGEPVLVDFGAVRDLGLPGASVGATVLGTPGYMAPEQALGRADARSDLYGLGATLAHAFTHRHPQDLLDEGMQVDAGALVHLPGQVAALIEALTRVDPRSRPTTAAAAIALLEEPTQQALARREAPARAVSQALARPDVPALVALDRGEAEHAPADGRALTKPAETALGQRLQRPQQLGKAIVAFTIAMTAVVAAIPFAPTFALFLVPLAVMIGAGGPMAMFLRQRTRWRSLYLHGVETGGTIIRANTMTNGTFVEFDYEADGQRHEGYAFTNDSLVVTKLERGAPVRVFYDPARPGENIGLVGLATAESSSRPALVEDGQRGGAWQDGER